MAETSVEKGFELFLKTLHENRGRSAEKYIALRERLERFFEWRGMENVEELADIVFDRVTKKMIDGEKVKNAEAYCVSIAKFVLLENRREVFKHKELDENSTDVNFSADDKVSVDDEELKDARLKCLDKCLTEIPTDKRKLLLGYFNTDEETMIPTRKKLAKNIGINLNTLRIRVSRLKTKLEKCTKECCEKS